MITRVQSNNNTPVAFGALKIKPVVLGDKAQKILSGASDFSSVHQRLALGLFALGIQPLIDLRNKDVDEDTRKVSAVRSAAKAIIGTITGIIVRGSCMKIAELKYAQRDAAGKILKEGKKIKIDPIKVQKAFGKGFDALKLDQKTLSDAVKRVPSVVGTIAALGVMIFTNFLIDAPLTNKTMDKINELMDKHFAKKKQESAGVANG